MVHTRPYVRGSFDLASEALVELWIRELLLKLRGKRVYDRGMSRGLVETGKEDH